MTLSPKDIVNKGFTREHYRSVRYNGCGRLYSFAEQICEVLALTPRSILEIGPGSGVVRSVVRKLLDCNYCTLDINNDLEPDVEGNVLAMPLGSELFDLVLCCEVLEHLPYGSFKTALSEIFRVGTAYALLTLPDASLKVRFDFPFFRKKVVVFPWFTSKLKNEHSHYWEIGRTGWPLSRLLGDIESCGFEIIKNYLIYESSGHRLLLLKKTSL